MSVSHFFKHFKEGMSEFGHNIALIVNTVLLTGVYLVGVGFTSVVAKIVGKKFMVTECDSKTKSYWKDLNVGNVGKKDMDDYYKQF